MGRERRVDIALQGPTSRDMLLSLHGSPEDKARVKALPWAGVTRANLGGYDLIVARTGYTGERVAFEIFIDPDKAPLILQGSGRIRSDSDRLGGARQSAHRGGFAAVWA